MVVAPGTNTLRRQQPALSEPRSWPGNRHAQLRKGVPRLRVCPLGCLCRHHFPVSQHGPGALLGLLPLSGVRDKSRPWARYGIPQAGRHAGGLSGHGHPAAVSGHRHTEGITRLLAL